MSVLLGLFSGAWAKLATIAALAFAIIGGLWTVRRSGEQAQQAADLSKQAKETEAAHAASNAVNGMSDAAVDSDMRKHGWYRD